jgi:hypothetical protein
MQLVQADKSITVESRGLLSGANEYLNFDWGI